jgi:hypothetical protein
MSPEEIDSLDAKSLTGLVLSLVARIDELSEQNKKILATTRRARIGHGRGRIAPIGKPIGRGSPTTRRRTARSSASRIAGGVRRRYLQRWTRQSRFRLFHQGLTF